MKLNTILTAALAAAFALPLAAQASDGDRLIVAQAGGPSGSSAVGTGPAGAPASPQSAGQPKVDAGHGSMGASGGATGSTRMSEPSFSMLDKNNDGQISRAEWDAHSRSGSGSASGGATTSPSGSVMSPSGSGTTGTTAGPGSASNRTAPSSDTATSPSTSGHGKPQ